MSDDIWVTLTEGTTRTGYHREYMKKLIQKILKKPENEREIRLRKRSYGYELWLPDLLAYVEKPGRGPQGRHKRRDLTESPNGDTL